MQKTSKHRGRKLWWSILSVAVLLAFGIGLSACGTGEVPVASDPAPPQGYPATPDSGLDPVPVAPVQPADPVQPDAPVQPADPGGVAIQVNDDVMTHKEFEEELQEQMEPLERQLGAMEQSPEIMQRLGIIRDQMKQQLVEQTVTRMLLEDYMDRSDIEVSEEEVDRQWDKIVSQYPDAETFEQTLQAQGVTVAEAREQLARLVKFDQLMIRELGEVEVTDAEVKAYYDMRPEEFSQPQVRARHILVEDGEGAEEAIQALHKLIEEGEDFETLARENSACPSAEQGGDLGFFGKGQMVEPFARQAFAMAPGEVSPPIRTQFGYHIIKLEEQREAKPFADVQEDVRERLGQQRAQAKQTEFFERLKQAAKVTVNVDPPASRPSLFPQEPH